jgi:hypothetical protein
MRAGRICGFSFHVAQNGASPDTGAGRMACEMVDFFLAVLGGRFFRNPRPGRILVLRSFQRGRAVAVRNPSVQRGRGATGHQRRGDEARSNSMWRRLSLGTNRISSFGVWRLGARRAAPRINRTGETRWHHMPERRARGFCRGTLP